MPFVSSLEEAEIGRLETPGPSTSSQQANLSDGPADPSTFSASAAVVIETEPESPLKEFYRTSRFLNRRNEERKHTSGFLELAAMFDQWSNLRFHRAYRNERWQLIFDKQCRLDCLNDQLRAYDENFPEGTRSLSANHKRPAGHPPTPNRREVILAEINKELAEHDRLTASMRIMEQQHPIHPEPFRNLFEHIYGNVIDRDACGSFKSPDDFVSPHPQAPYWVTETSSRIMRLYARFFKPDSHTEDNYVPMAILTVIFKTIHVVAAGLLLLITAALLYLCNFDNSGNFAIICVSTLVFCAAISAKSQLDNTMTALAGCAYLAFCGAFAAGAGFISAA
ncbi:hypothetical protein QC761_0036530 [Podospora bellae-mahoneyi]|uniref:DUF6594 domain-containing protein n=1 Tax=Podospora bellae-mahoneyi TaxID=2093777 RepID=A0ABR0FR71_9PEZI|nr:hypothetical protein QC761_0036530 [Podospora bellae-mahoneyi]